jgi:hypothetical protein
MPEPPRKSRRTAPQPPAQRRPAPPRVARPGARVADMDARQRVALSLILRPDAPPK